MQDSPLWPFVDWLFPVFALAVGPSVVAPGCMAEARGMRIQCLFHFVFFLMKNILLLYNIFYSELALAHNEE